MLAGDQRDIWLPGLYRIKSYLTGLIQDFSTKERIPLEEVILMLSFRDNSNEHINYSGLNIDSWDCETKMISEGAPMEGDKYLESFSFILFKNSDNPNVEKCSFPLYATVDRKGDWNRSGRNHNLIGMFELETETIFDVSHWIKRGVAMCTQDDFIN